MIRVLKRFPVAVSLVLAGLLVVTHAAPAAAVARDRSCAPASVMTAAGPLKLYFRTRRTPCGTARRVIRAYFARTPAQCVGAGCFISLPSGWRCHTAPGAVTERDGSVADCSSDGGARRILTSRFRSRGFERAERDGIVLTSQPARGQVVRSSAARTNEVKTWIGIFPRLYEPGVDARYYRRPHRFRLVSADSEILFEGLHWRNWGSGRTIAKGRARTCGEGGIDGYVCSTGAVRLVAGRIGSCPTGGDLYQSLLAFHVPLYGKRTEIPVIAESCGPPRRCVGLAARCGQDSRAATPNARLACDECGTGS